MGDWSGFMDKIHEAVPMDQQPELLQKLQEGNFTLRIMYEQFQNILNMGPLGQVIVLFPAVLRLCLLVTTNIVQNVFRIRKVFSWFRAFLHCKVYN